MNPKPTRIWIDLAELRLHIESDARELSDRAWLETEGEPAPRHKRVVRACRRPAAQRVQLERGLHLDRAHDPKLYKD